MGENLRAGRAALCDGYLCIRSNCVRWVSQIMCEESTEFRYIYGYRASMTKVAYIELALLIATALYLLFQEFNFFLQDLLPYKYQASSALKIQQNRSMADFCLAQTKAA